MGSPIGHVDRGHYFNLQVVLIVSRPDVTVVHVQVEKQGAAWPFYHICLLTVQDKQATGRCSYAISRL